jgi:Cu(I)/Ag(I) efflux system membrane protein CusA/SilA
MGVKIYGAKIPSKLWHKKLKKTLEGTEGVKDLYAEPITGGSIRY